MLRTAFCLTLAWLAMPVQAQEQISPEAFLDQAVGNTLTFRSFDSGSVVGEEEFLRRDLSVWVQPNGRCTYGKIEIRGPRICFIYEDFPDPDNCWLPFRYQDQIVVMAMGSGELQRVTEITDTPLSCEGAPLS
ncbi:MAG: hypothetical protein AAF744_02455 [Pseudomonadota bacterium]